MSSLTGLSALSSVPSIFGGGGLVGFEVYGGLYVDDGSTPQSDIDITPAKKLTGWTTAFEAKNITVSVANDDITLLRDGVYMGWMQISFTGTPVTEFEVHLYVNGVEQPDGFHRIVSGSDTGSASMVIGPKSLSAGDILDLRVNADSDNRTITMVDAQWVMAKI